MKKMIRTIASCTFVIACSNDSSPEKCAAPGEATPGPADTHCSGLPAQVVNVASCFADAGDIDAGSDDDGGATSCDYEPTMYGQEGDDDDCKYHVAWTSTPICEGKGGVEFTVTATNLIDGSPVANIPGGIIVETFIPEVADAACDDRTLHPSPNIGAYLVESPAGSGVYSGLVVFDAPAVWTLRFHIHEECSDTLDDSPHGHAAFHITVP